MNCHYVLAVILAGAMHSLYFVGRQTRRLFSGQGEIPGFLAIIMIGLSRRVYQSAHEKLTQLQRFVVKLHPFLIWNYCGVAKLADAPQLGRYILESASHS